MADPKTVMQGALKTPPPATPSPKQAAAESTMAENQRKADEAAKKAAEPSVFEKLKKFNDEHLALKALAEKVRRKDITVTAPKEGETNGQP